MIDLKIITLKPNRKYFSECIPQLKKHGYKLQRFVSKDDSGETAVNIMHQLCFKVVPNDIASINDYERRYGKPFGVNDNGEFKYCRILYIYDYAGYLPDVLGGWKKPGNSEICRSYGFKNDRVLKWIDFVQNPKNYPEDNRPKGVSWESNYDHLKRWEAKYKKEVDEIRTKRRAERQKVQEWLDEFQGTEYEEKIRQYNEMIEWDKRALERKLEEVRYLREQKVKDTDYLLSSDIEIDYKNKYYTERMGVSDRMEYGAYRHIVDNECFGTYFRCIANAVIPLRNFGFTEVDGLVISENGIFVVEAKCYSFTVHAKDTEKEWGYDCQDKPKFNSPLFQNLHHANILREYLYDHPMEGLPVRDIPMTLLIAFPSDIEVERGEERIRLDKNMQYYIGSVNMDHKGGMTSDESDTDEIRLRNQFKPLDMPKLTVEQIDALYDHLAGAFIQKKDDRGVMIQERLWDSMSIPKNYKYFVTPNNNVIRSDNYSLDVATTFSTRVWCSYGTEELAKKLYARNKWSDANGIKGPYRDFDYACGVARNMGGYK